MYRLLLAFGLFTIAYSAKAQWLCTHPQLCQMVVDYYQEIQAPLPKLATAISAVGDPHHIEPSSAEIKAMTKTEVLLSADASLHPWSRPIVENRKNKKHLKTILFTTPVDYKQELKEASNEALAHFWLYPKIHCAYWQQFHRWLNADETIKAPECPYRFLEEKLKLAAKRVTIPVILSHDALVPLLRSWGVDAHAIRGSGHHEEPRPNELKKLQDLLKKHPKVLWIVESRIHFPNALKQMQRTSDKKLDLDTTGEFPKVGLAPLQRLDLLFSKL